MAERLLKSTATVGSITLISRILGLIRDLVFATFFGASGAYDAFILAFKIPNFLRRMFAEGAFAQAFVPLLSEYKTTQNAQEEKAFIDHAFGALAGVLIAVTALGVCLAPVLIVIFSPGFLETPDRYDMAVGLLRITFPYILFISLTALAGGILNTYGVFSVPALTPVLLNLSLITAAMGLSTFFDPPAKALAWGVFIGGGLQLLFQIPFLLRLDKLPRFKFNLRHPGIQRMFKLMAPALVGASVMQVNLMVDTLFASFLPQGSLSWLYYSDRLLEFPIGIFGVALATVVLPHLSKAFASKQSEQFSNSVDWALRWSVLGGLPCAVGIGVLAQPILITLFVHGEFTGFDAWMAAKSLWAFSFGLLWFILVKVLVSAFYAQQNTRFPLKVALWAMGANVVLNALLIYPLAHAGLALASGISAWFQAGILLWALRKKKAYRPMGHWRLFLLRVVLANVSMIWVLFHFNPSIVNWTQAPLGVRVTQLTALIVAGALTYAGVLWGSGLRKKHLELVSPSGSSVG